MTFAVEFYFTEQGREVYDAVTFGDRWAAECYLVALAGGTVRGGRWIHVTHARIVRWTA